MNRIRTLGKTALLTLLLGFIGCAVKSQVESPQPDNRSSLATAYSNNEPTTLAFAEGGVYKGEGGRTDTPVVDVWLTFDQYSSDVGKRFSLAEESIGLPNRLLGRHTARRRPGLHTAFTESSP